MWGYSVLAFGVYSATVVEHGNFEVFGVPWALLVLPPKLRQEIRMEMQIFFASPRRIQLW